MSAATPAPDGLPGPPTAPDPAVPTQLEPEALLGPLPPGLADTGLPVPPGYRLPDGYRVTPAGIALARERKDDVVWEPVLAVPVVPTAYVRLQGDLQTRLDWLRDGQLHSTLRPATELASDRRIISLAGMGLPVTSITARALVAYISACEAINQYRLPTATGTAHMGWQADGSYLVGRLLLTGDGRQVATQDLDRIDPADWHPGQVYLHCEPGTGEDQAVDAHREHGSLQGWLDTVALAHDHPRVMLALYASLAAPLLEILGCPGYTLDLSTPTSRGKTTALRVAMSPWGLADPLEPDRSVIGTWHTTAVAVERALALRRGIPLALDDTSLCQRPELMSQVLYGAASGHGKARGALRGSQETSGHRTVLLSTGEAPITSYAVAGGQHARALCLTRAPLPHDPELVARLQAGTAMHYGVPGVVWVSWLLRHRHEWPAWRERYAALRADRAVGVSAVAGRLGAYTAAITLACELAERALGLPGVDPVPELAEELAEGAGQADLARAAMQAVLGRCRACPAHFWRAGHLELQLQPVGGWWGSWDLSEDVATGHTTWTRLALHYHVAERLLTEAGYTPAAILRAWADRDWIARDGRNHAPKVRIQGQRARCVVILPGADHDPGGADHAA